MRALSNFHQRQLSDTRYNLVKADEVFTYFLHDKLIGWTKQQAPQVAWLVLWMTWTVLGASKLRTKRVKVRIFSQLAYPLSPYVETIPTFDGIFISVFDPFVHGLVNTNKKNGFSQTSPWFDWDQNSNFNRFSHLMAAPFMNWSFKHCVSKILFCGTSEESSLRTWSNALISNSDELFKYFLRDKLIGWADQPTKKKRHQQLLS